MTVSFSVYRRGVRSGQGQKRYTIELRLPDGTKSTRIGFTDKAATLQLAARLVREIERKEVGLVDLLAGSRRTPLAEHLETFLRAMKQGTLGRRRHVSAGQFPRPIHFGENEQRTPARWLRSEIEAWVQRCAQGRAS